MSNIEIIVSGQNCCGCSVCSHVCPNSAISMATDEHGFMHPKVDKALCTNCGICERVCPEIESDKEKQERVSCYGIINNNKEIKKNSTSGGLFSLLADYVIDSGGAVYGAIYNAGTIEHIRVIGDYDKMRGSKYCQSTIDGVIEAFLNDLNHGVKVLFTGTPCQCASLKKLLRLKKIPSENCILVDIVCHGVVSPMLLKDYIAYVEKKTGKEIAVHKFRDKVNGWSQHTESNIFVDGSYDYQSYESQLYKRIFLNHYGLREACFNCKYTCYDRVSDITMADFWGLNKTRPEMWNNDGVSFAIVSTEKGDKIIDAIRDKGTVFDATIDDTKQPQLLAPSNRPEGYEEFWNCYLQHGFKKIVVKYFHGGVLRRLASDLINKFRG